MWFGIVSEHVVELGPIQPNTSVPGASIGEIPSSNTVPVLSYERFGTTLVCVCLFGKGRYIAEREQ